MTVHRPPTARPHHRETKVYSHTFWLVWEPKRKLLAHQCFDQLTAVKTPVSPDHTAGASVDPSRSSIFWSYPLTNYYFQMIAGSSLFFPMIHIKYGVFMSLWPRTTRILISNWPLTRKFSQFFKNTGGEDLFCHGHALVTLYVQFFALIGHNLTGEIIRKIYAASWILFTLTAEADRVLSQLVMFLTIFFLWMYKMK